MFFSYGFFRVEAKTVYELINIIQQNVISPLITLFMVLATAFFIWGVIEFLGGADSEEARTRGKRHMIWGLVGLVIMLSVKFIINLLENFFSSIG